ncbi:T9SS type A sorting domain-containing protein [Fidelibacter multiformis]|uniref:T9SS type A sorting domain-containing protein n=1 Tax=Fidelibacter multiformis TaxID=3377529 RepID=UPI0037DCCED0
MKKSLLKILVITLFITGTVFGQQYILKWANYDVIDRANDVTRGLVYNPYSDHVLVATRFGGNRVVKLDPETGYIIGMLDTTDTGFEGGTYPLNLVDIADDGTIYVCNLSVPSNDPNDRFRIYRYTDESAAPELVFDDALDGNRYGDSFAVEGKGDNTWFYTSGYQNDKMAVLKIGTRGIALDHYIELPSINSARHGISPVSPGGNLWINGAGDSYPPVRLISNDGNIIATVPDSIIAAGGTGTVHHVNLGSFNLVFAVNVFLTNAVRAGRYYEDELGTITFDYFGDNSDSLMLGYQGNELVNNQNGSSALSYDSTRHVLYALNGVNSVAALDLNGLLRIATPRDQGAATIQIDGKKKEYFHYDHVGTSQDRDLYLTWGSNAVYFGITGHTLQDATLQNQLFLAFDLDPDGDGGSSVPPSDAGGVSALPFKADVVVHLEPWDNFDYTTGWVYTWNGSEWVVGSSIDGFDIGYGAMAWVGGETDTTLTEVAVAFNSAGLGEDFTNIRMMTYSAEAGSDGAILCAFPDVNPTETGAAFTAYYEADSLGSGMYAANPEDLRIVNTGVGIQPGTSLPSTAILHKNYPNPFNPKTVIPFTLREKARVELKIFDLRGQEVHTLADEVLEAGTYTRILNGEGLASGVYFYQLRVNHTAISTQKMVYLK